MNSKKLFFNDWLQGQLKNPKLKKAYREEDVRARLSIRIAEVRKKKKISQAQLPE